jgi:predicted RNase H-like nuclease (RuvC/YqgF family)
MPIATKRPSTATGEAFDVHQMQHLGQHPAVQPLHEHRSALRRRLSALRQEHTKVRQQLYTMRSGDDFSVQAMRRQMEKTIEQLEQDGASAEAELREVLVSIETAEAAARVELRPLLAQEGVPIVSALLVALEQLEVAATTYQAYSARYRNIVGDSSLPTFGFDRLGACCTYAQEALARLRQLAAREG